VTFDFDSGPQYSSLPLDLTVNGVTAHFTGGYSIQQVGTVGISPAGFSGLCLFPSSVFQSDLGIGFSETMTDFSILYAVDELGCDTSARMRVTAYMNGAFVGTNTMVAPVPGSYPSATLGIVAPTGFNSVVVHWDAPGTLCQDYGPIFLADIVTLTRAAPVGVGDEISRGVPRLFDPAPNPFQRTTTIRFVLPEAGDVRLEVYDLSGRLVRRLLGQPQPAGNRTVAWDGVDDAGRRVSAGVYVLRFETVGHRQYRRMVFLK
jgi:hypothetical protein